MVKLTHDWLIPTTKLVGLFTQFQMWLFLTQHFLCVLNTSNGVDATSSCEPLGSLTGAPPDLNNVY